MFYFILIILLLFLLFKKCNIENYSDRCNDCINMCTKSSSLPYCIDKCYSISKKCNKKLPKEYKKYYNLHYNYNYLSHDGNKLFLSKDRKKYVPLKVIKTKKKIYIQTKLNCFGKNDNCNYYLGVKDNKVDFYNKKSIKKKDRNDIKWKFFEKKDKILLKNRKKYLNNKLQLVKGKNNAAQFSVDKLSDDILLRRL